MYKRQHYLEAMACPSGCVNGGGSAARSTTGTMETATESRIRVGQTLGRLQTPMTTTASKNEEASSKNNYYRTQFHVVPTLQVSRGAAAGVEVQALNW